jgi:hypothetical protein
MAELEGANRESLNQLLARRYMCQHFAHLEAACEKMRENNEALTLANCTLASRLEARAGAGDATN